MIKYHSILLVYIKIINEESEIKILYKFVVAQLVCLIFINTVAAEEKNESKPNVSIIDSIKIDGWAEGGNVINFNNPKDRINWGQQIADQTGLSFNQSVLKVYREIDDKSKFDIGFKYSGLLGTDADYVQLLGQTEYLMNGKVQFASPEAYIKIHTPFFTKNGINFKIGQFLTYNGLESIYAPENFFYTHSYTSEFGPWTTTGVMAETKVTDDLEIYAGPITGFNTSIGWPGSNTSSPGLHAGFNLSILDGDFIVSGTNMSAPQQGKQLDPYHVGWPNGTVGGVPADCLCDPNNTWSYANNLMLSYFPSDRLTLMADINYNRQDLSGTVYSYGLTQSSLTLLSDAGYDTSAISNQRSVRSQSYGAAVYGLYKVNEVASLGTRIEYWRDDRNGYANAPLRPFDIVNSLHNFPNELIKREFGQGTSYFAITAGAKIIAKVPEVPYLREIIFRPQARWDVSVNGKAPFFNSYEYGGKSTQGMLTFDVIVPISIKE
jgi:hypothetical protein